MTIKELHAVCGNWTACTTVHVATTSFTENSMTVHDVISIEDHLKILDDEICGNELLMNSKVEYFEYDQRNDIMNIHIY